MSRVPRALLACVAVAATLGGGCSRTSPPDASVALVFGKTGLGPGEFSYPRAATLGRDGALYIVDKSARIQRYTPDGGFELAWRMPEWDAGKPTGLGVGPDGRIYVADTHYARVAVFEPDGTPVRTFGRRGTGPGEFLMPTDVAVDRDGFIFVAEYGGNDRVSKFTPDGAFVVSFGEPGPGPGQLQRPQSLAIDADGFLWIADACNHRICRYDREGRFIASFGHSGNAAGQMRFPYGLTILPDGSLIVAEYGNNRLQRFDWDGRSLGVWGVPGRRRGELAYPWDVVVGATGQVFVIDSGNNRVQVLRRASAISWQGPTSDATRG